jgi:hypothetical protein
MKNKKVKKIEISPFGLWIFLKVIFLKNSLKRIHQNQMKNKPHQPLIASSLEMGNVTIPKINNNLYSVPIQGSSYRT